MKLTTKGLLTASLLCLSASAFAAKPTSITFEAEGKAPDGQEYASYVVKCSDGSEKPLTAWDSRKKWCVGKMSQEGCEKKQIRAAKNACK